MSSAKIHEGYEKVKIVGQGSFGRATLYRRLKDGKHVVMKEIFMLDMDNSEKKEAQNEVEILSTLNHPNIISYLGSFESEGSLIIIMEYADGGNLAQLINAKKNKNEIFTEKSILNILQQICSAMAYMHTHKILHRDLKTANIFLNMTGSVKVGDFGISKMLNTRSQAQTVVGTPYYLSPEMCEGSDYNEKSDIWAIGCILYELACLRKPFEAMTLPVLLQKITLCQYDNIPNFYTQELSQLVRAILQKNPTFRPSARYIHDNAIPKITKKGQIITSSPPTATLKFGVPVERSILYKMYDFGDEQKIVPIELPHKKILDFNASSTHQIAVTSDNMVYTWGDNNYGQLALSCDNKGYPACVNYLRNEKIVQCCAGEEFSIFLNDEGNVFSCGNGHYGCLGHGNWENLSQPTLITSLENAKIVQISCGDEHVVALSSEGKVLSWGSAKEGALGQGHTQHRCKPLAIKLAVKVKKVFCGKNATAALATNGQIFVTGSNSCGKLGMENHEDERIISFTALAITKEKVQFISIGINHSAILTENGIVLIFGRNQQQMIKLKTKITMVSCGINFTVAVDQENVLWFWGGSFKKIKNRTLVNPLARSSNSVIPLVQNETMIVKDVLKKDDFEMEVVKVPRSILAFYSSKQNVKSGNIIYFGNILTNGGEIFIVAHTTTPPVITQFSHNDLHKSKVVKKATYYQESKAFSSSTKLPNIP